MRVIDRTLGRTDPAGYEVWSETYQMGDVVAEEIREEGDDSPQTEEVSEVIEAFEGASGQVNTHEVAYNPEGAYIGDLDRAKFLCEKRGIAPELMRPGGKVCSIGFCEAGRTAQSSDLVSGTLSRKATVARRRAGRPTI